MTSSRSVFVTGGLGFIGCALVKALLETTGYRVVNLDAHTYAANTTALSCYQGQPNYRLVNGNICDAELVADIFADEAPVAVIHTAAESHVDRSISDPSGFLRTNVEGTLVLLQESCKYWERLLSSEQRDFRFLHVSTDEVYGSLEACGLFTEDSAYLPNSPYAASKAASNHFVRAFWKTYGLPVITSICCNNFGPLQNEEKLIPKMILRAARGESLPVFGDGKQVRDWLYVGDHVAAILAILKYGKVGEVYNVGTNCEKSNIDLVCEICDQVDLVLGRPSAKSATHLIEFVADRPGHDRRYAIDATKICNSLHWRAKTPFQDALSTTIRWYLADYSLE